jgi:hypothetical protein
VGDDHSLRWEGDFMSKTKLKAAPQRLVLCRMMFDLMRHLHGTYAPDTEPFGARIETFFIGLGLALGDIEGKPFSTNKIALYMRTPRTRVRRRLIKLEQWGLIERRGQHFYMNEERLNDLVGMLAHARVKTLVKKAAKDLAVLDTMAD